jgi:hypothetical protein
MLGATRARARRPVTEESTTQTGLAAATATGGSEQVVPGATRVSYRHSPVGGVSASPATSIRYRMDDPASLLLRRLSRIAKIAARSQASTTQDPVPTSVTFACLIEAGNRGVYLL